jgi:serine/threonine-protein kinase
MLASGSSEATIAVSPRRAPASDLNTSGSFKSSDSGHPASGQQMAPGTVLAGRYRVVAPIGRGGMGQVYRAEDLKLGETVALKFLPEQLAQDAAWLGRFFMEVRTAREVTHPNVCRVHDVVEATDSAGRPLYFLTMEYVDGENLADLVKRFGRLPTEKGMEIAGQITAALTAAHEKGVLHRDIKPANVMIDGRGQAKLADFGLAVASNAVQAAEIAGTPGYIAPEILRGAQATGRSDLYSLGLVLYELLTGRKAVKDGKAVTGSVRQYAPDISPAAEKAVQQCMDPDPAKRPASAMEVLRAFPARNALEAALARGETPSPEMVADSADDQPMPLRTAWWMVAAVCLILVATWLASRWGGYLEVKPPQLSTEEMIGKAQEHLRAAGYSAKGTAQISVLEDNFAVLDWASATASPAQKKSFASTPQGSLTLIYRQSATQNLLAAGNVSAVASSPTVNQLARNIPDSQSVTVDSDGNLLNLNANPEGSSNAVSTEVFDWTIATKAIGVDPNSVVEKPADFTPPYAFDQRRVWKAYYPGHPEDPLQVEAAVWHGKLNYLKVSGPWDHHESPLSSRITTLSIELGEVLALILGLLLAVYNLRRKRGDVKSATRLALFSIFLSVLVFALFSLQPRASHDFNDYIGAFFQSLGERMVEAAFLWIAYIAVEPLTRKRFPQLLVASSLILQGRWRSPRVGKEILTGALFGVASALWWQSTHALEWRHMAGSTLDVFPAVALNGFSHLAGFTAAHVNDGLTTAAESTVLLTVFMLAVRNRWGLFVLLALAEISQEETRGALLAAALVTVNYACNSAYLLLRVGLVAVVTVFLVSNTADSTAWVHSWDSWLLPEMAWSVLFILGITAFGFWLAIGDQKPFGDLRIDE